MILLDEVLLLLCYALFTELLCDNVCSRRASNLLQFYWLEPAFRLDHFFADRLQAQSIVIQCL